MEKEEIKTIKVNKKTWKVLMKQKIDGGFETVEGVIKQFLGLK